MSQSNRADYLALGHPTLDVRLSVTTPWVGRFLYAGLQAARLQQRTVILGRANAGAIAPRWSAYADEAELCCRTPRRRPSSATWRTATTASSPLWIGPGR
jgi:hypothetical protein